jgi:CheY-like chemotaxis protein
VYGIVTQSLGSISVASERERGTAFTILLPRHGDAAAEAKRPDARSPAERGRETLLLVEDEPALLSLTGRVLRGLGYAVLSASSPREAIRLAGAHEGEIHLLVSDVIMPEMNGYELGATLAALRPGLRRLFMSGYPADVISEQGVLREGTSLLQKPFSQGALAAKVREVLDAPPER